MSIVFSNHARWSVTLWLAACVTACGSKPDAGTAAPAATMETDDLAARAKVEALAQRVASRLP